MVFFSFLVLRTSTFIRHFGQGTVFVVRMTKWIEVNVYNFVRFKLEICSGHLEDFGYYDSYMEYL